MMSLERFLRECEALIRGKEPFLGYWHAHGFGLIRTGTIFEESFVLHCQRHNGEKYTLRAQNAFYRDSYLRDLRRDGERLLNIDIVKKPRKVKSSHRQGHTQEHRSDAPRPAHCRFAAGGGIRRVQRHHRWARRAAGPAEGHGRRRVKFVPYPYQEAAIRWVLDRPASGLFLGMGMGKTVVTLTAINELLFDRLEAARVLVIAPLRVARDTWAREAAKWDHLQHLRVSVVLGDARERLAALERPAEVYVINRENVPWLCETLFDWPFDMVVIDELSSFKSVQAKRFKALRKVRGRIRRIVGLTGTPAPNGLIDLWPQIYLLDRGERLGKTVGAYRARYFTPDRANGHIVYSYRLLPGADEAIQARIADVCMSLRKEDYLSLPGQLYETVEITPPPALLKQYRQFERDRIMEAMDGDGEIVALKRCGPDGQTASVRQWRNLRRQRQFTPYPQPEA